VYERWMDGHGIEPRVFACWGLSHRLLACPRDRYSAGGYWWWWRGQMNENDEGKKKETMLPLFLLFFCVCGETADSLLSRTSTEHCTCNYCTVRSTEYRYADRAFLLDQR
jgi:hypothetical protein